MSLKLDLLLKKISRLNKLRYKEAILAYSGGLDSTLCISLLKKVYKIKRIFPILFDVGQGKESIREAQERAAFFGCEKLIIIDIKKEFYEKWIKLAIQANANIRGYPFAAPIAKQILGYKLGKLSKRLKVHIIAEGSSGKGNDQFRISTSVKYSNSKCKIIAPIRELNLNREEEEMLCDYWNVPIDDSVTKGGDDVTLWCRSIGSGAFSLNEELSSSIWKWISTDTNKKGSLISIDFEKGVPIRLDNKLISVKTILKRLNKAAGKQGVGIVDIIEDNIFGIKGREIYEAPAAKVILAAHYHLESLCLSSKELEIKRYLEMQWSKFIYNGHLYDPVNSAISKFFLETQKNVNGKIKLILKNGSIQVVKRSSQKSRYSSDLRSLYHSKLNQQLMEGAVYAHSLAYGALNKK